MERVIDKSSPLTSDTLPDDPAALRRLLIERDQQIQSLRTQLDTLYAQLRLMKSQRFGASSEQHPAVQSDLFFNEAEVDATEVVAIEPPARAPKTAKKKPGRVRLPPELPRVEVVHDLPESQKVCPHDGTTLTRIGEEVSEQIDIIPAKVQVLRHVRPTYACRHCEGHLATAPVPPTILPRALASAGTCAHVITAKFEDALPLYRQEKIFQRMGIELPRATLANWSIALGASIQPLINLLQDQLLDSPYLQCDETTVQVLKQPGKKPTDKAYLWVRASLPPGRRVLLYEYDPSRSRETARRLLQDYHGTVQTDGYGVYDRLLQPPDIRHLGCWSHCRRKYDEAIKGLPRGAPPGLAGEALARIQALYAIEARAENDPQRAELRAQHSQALLHDLKHWLDRHLPQVPPQSLLGKALRYHLGQWDKLLRCFEEPHLRLDTNLVENAIRPFVIGRRNWLFCDTVRGAKASANLYSLIQTAKANGHQPYAYLRDLFTRLPRASTVADYEALLPWNLHPATLPTACERR